MPTVAEQLRAAREAQRLSIEQVAELTKIRTDHIRALERGNFNAFPAVIYIRGSVKNYAAMLKLDLPQILAELDTELKGTDKFAEPPPLVEQKKNILDHLALLAARISSRTAFVILAALGAVGIVVIGIHLWRQHLKHEPLPQLPPAVYQPSNSGVTLPLPKK